MVDIEKIREKNWTGECTDCNWSHSSMAFAGVNAEALVHVHNNNNSHSIEIYRGDDLMEVIDDLAETGSEYLTENSAPLRERE
jgi:hypothetical protein